MPDTEVVTKHYGLQELVEMRAELYKEVCELSKQCSESRKQLSAASTLSPELVQQCKKLTQTRSEFKQLRSELAAKKSELDKISSVLADILATESKELKRRFELPPHLEPKEITEEEYKRGKENGENNIFMLPFCNSENED